MVVEARLLGMKHFLMSLVVSEHCHYFFGRQYIELVLCLSKLSDKLPQALLLTVSQTFRLLTLHYVDISNF